MRKLLQFTILISLISCQNQNKKVDLKTAEKETYIDTTEKAKTTDIPSENILDFIWKFSDDSDFQVSRIDFPLKLGDSLINKPDWQHDRQFIDLEYTFYLFKGHDFNFGYSRDFGNKAILSWVHPIDSNVIDYVFNRINSTWRLAELNSRRFERESLNDIPVFISSFFTDTVFHKSHIKYPLEYNTWIGDEMDSKDTTYIIERKDINLIQRYKGEIRFPLFSLNGVSLDDYDSKFILFLGGNDNGYHVRYYFEKIDNEWILTKMNDDSN